MAQILLQTQKKKKKKDSILVWWCGKEADLRVTELFVRLFAVTKKLSPPQDFCFTTVTVLQTNTQTETVQKALKVYEETSFQENSNKKVSFFCRKVKKKFFFSFNFFFLHTVPCPVNAELQNTTHKFGSGRG